MIQPNTIPEIKLCDESIAGDERKWTIENVHDPAIFKDEDWYYVFSTDAQVGGCFKAGIQIRKSKDLINWEWVGRAFSKLPRPAVEWTGASGFWAPEIVKFADTYFMYYSASQFGRNQSFIGVATSKNIEGPWEDQGEVFKTRHGIDEPNAIDANITIDRNGDPWMVYGSFFGGIYLNRIDPKSGKLLHYGKGKLIAKRHRKVEGAIEGPYIIYNPEFDYYYLFVSYDSLFSNYNIRVARSKTIEGPYVDVHGNEMTNTTLPPNEVGLKILGGYHFGDGEGWVAPGHNSVLKDGDDYYVVHHMRAEKDRKYHYLHIRKVVWTANGWPLVSPERFAGEEQRPIETKEILGEWAYIFVDRDQNEQNVARYFSIDSEGENWKRLSSYQFLLSLDESNQGVECTVMPAWDWARKVETYVFIGMDSKGQVFIGKKKQS